MSRFNNRDRVSLAMAICAITLSSCATEEWSRADTAWQLAHLGVVIADAHMTSKIQNHPNIVEVGPVARHFLGANPEQPNTFIYFATVEIFHWGVARMLPSGWRRLWQVGGIYMHSEVVLSGYKIGLFDKPCTAIPCESPP